MKNTANYVNGYLGFLTRLIFLFFCLLFSVTRADSQSHYIDSLKTVLNRTDITDSARIALYEEIGYNLNKSSPQLARLYFLEAFNLLRKNHYVMESGVALAYIGMNYEETDQLDSAVYFIDRAISIMRQDSSKKAKANIGSLLNEKANIDKARGLYYSAIDNYIQSNEITKKYETNEKWMNIAITNLNIAQVFQEMGQFDKAIDYDKEALENIKTGQSSTRDTTFLNVLYRTQVNVKLNMAENFIYLGENKSAEAELNRLQPVLRNINDDNLYAYYYAIKGAGFASSADLESAKDSYLKSLQYSENISYRKLKAFQALGNIAKKLGEYPASIQYFKMALALKPTVNKKANEAIVMKSLAEVYALDKQYKNSVTGYKAFVSLNDSLNTINTKIKINEIENKYQAKQKQDSILVLQKNNQIQSLALNKKRSLNNALWIGLILLVSIALLVYRNLRHRHYILKQNELLHKQRIHELEKEHQLVAMQSVLKGQEEERSRLAKDLHDGVGGLLSGVKLSLSTMKGNVFLSEQNAQSVNNVIVQLDQSITELRRVSHNMMPEALIKFGLKEALENYCENINLSGKLKVQMQAYGLENRMEQSTEIVLYRMVQELLNNVIKHADAKNVLVQLTREDERFSLTVEDDGKGFDQAKADSMEGAGIANVKARAEYLNGTVDIQSAPGDGTSVNIVGKCA